MHIDSYSFGTIIVNGKTYDKDLIIFPDKIIPNWWRKDGHSLAIEDLKEVFSYKPDILIIGRGTMSVMQVPEATKKAIGEGNIELLEANTEQATHLFNKAIENEKKAVCALHLTC